MQEDLIIAYGLQEREKLAGDFRANIESHAATLARLAPNLKAVEQFEAIKVPIMPGSNGIGIGLDLFLWV